jgi:hypothetical protein
MPFAIAYALRVRGFEDSRIQVVLSKGLQVKI